MAIQKVRETVHMRFDVWNQGKKGVMRGKEG